MKKMTTKFMCLLVAIMFALVCVGCGGGKEIDTDIVILGEEDILNYDGVIEFDFRVPSGIIATALETIIPEFEAKWNNKIDVELVIETDGYDGVRKTTILDLNSQVGPTMVLGYPDHFAEYFSGEYMVNLSEYIAVEEDFQIEDFVQSYLDENRISDENDDLYGLPLNKSTEILIYNKTIFDAMGYKVPATWGDLEVLSKQIWEDVAAGKLDSIITLAEGEKKPSEFLAAGQFIPFAYDSTDNAFITMTRQFKGAYTERVNIEQGYALFDNEQVKAGLEYFKGLSTKGYYAVAENFGESYASNAFKALTASALSKPDFAAIAATNSVLFITYFLLRIVIWIVKPIFD